MLNTISNNNSSASWHIRLSLEHLEDDGSITSIPLHAEAQQALMRQVFGLGADAPVNIEALAAGQMSARAFEAAPRRSALDRLTPREREVTDLLVEGLSTKVIAYRLAISPRTVDLHRGRVMKKLGARNAAQVVRLALAS